MLVETLIDFDLPNIVVVGNQSAGKSSLIEALVRIPLPRSEGTCTRCPMECRLVETPHGPTKYMVTIRKEKDAAGNSLAVPVEIKFGDPITDFDEVEERIRQAQKAVLNPTRSEADFLGLLDMDHVQNELKFTENIVCILVTGSVCHLSLIDLPGIISVSEKKEDAPFVDMIRNLVVKYVSKPSTFILSAITCKDDIENQSVSGIAREYDPEGSRTIGVLTKPDMIEEGTHGPFLDLLKGKRLPLKHGYYMVKNPNKVAMDRQISFDDARAEEMAFFQSKEPWSKEPSSRFGIHNMRRDLGEKLVDKVNESIPHILADANQLLQKIRAELRVIPEGIQNTQLELQKLLGKFCTKVKSQLVEEADQWQEEEATFWYSQMAAMSEFRERIQKEQPAFIDSGFASKYFKKAPTKIYSLETVKKMMQKSSGRHLPGQGPPVVFRIITKAYQVNWESPAFELIDQVEVLMHNWLQKLVKLYFERFPKLMKRMIGHVSDFVRHCKKNQLVHVKECIEAELGFLYSLNDHYYLDQKERFIEAARDYLAEEMEEESADKITNEARRVLQQNSRSFFSDKMCNRLLSGAKNCSPEHKEAIDIMAETRAYWKVAYKRYVDSVAIRVQRFVEMVANDNAEFLYEAIQEVALDKAKTDDLLMETNSIVSRREELIRSEERISNVIKAIRDY